jgi:ATPase family associated with various cellular activities (AAA)
MQTEVAEMIEDAAGMIEDAAGMIDDEVLTPELHSNLYLYGAVLQLLRNVAESHDSWEEVFEQYPFLGGYYREVMANGVSGMSVDEAAAFWRRRVEGQEADAHLPLRALGAAYGLDYDALLLLMFTGLAEEDARFGAMFERMQVGPGHHRPTVGLLNELWQETIGDVQRPLRALRECGLVEVVNPESPRAEWALRVPAPLWDALRGQFHETPAPWARYHPPASLTAIEDLVVSDATRSSLETVAALLSTGEVRTLVVRGPRHNGRRTTLGAVARRLGRGVIEVEGFAGAGDERWRLLGPLATLLDAMPVVALDPAPGETAQVPRLRGEHAVLGLAVGRQGGLSGAGVERSLTLNADVPDESGRTRLWERGFGGRAFADASEMCGRLRLTSGNILRAARLASARASLEGRERVVREDVSEASRALNRQALDTLATRVHVEGDWGQLAAGPETLRELQALESRCRHRERLRESVGEAFGRQLGCGVRALFGGPSGTGKTLAARLLASTLGLDLYRLDLSSVVNKYIGETEKGLNQLFARAEELDVILLLDEGDALLTQRTSVQSSNDRYANLETNYLLQRLESYEGVIVVTTNAAERIDSAFQRRMDVVVDFRPPEPAERWLIWQLHLPAAHAVERAVLEEVAHRCALTGGQIRNAVLHASLLALDEGEVVTASHLEAAVRREYRKAGAVCPLRPSTPGSWN